MKRLVAVLALSMSGCDQIKELIGPPQAAPETNRLRELAAPVPVPKAPPPPNDAEILASFHATPPDKRSDVQLRTLSEFPKALLEFRELDLSNSKVTDIGGPLLEKFENLEALVMPNTRITDATLKGICRLTRLQRLDISTTQVSDTGMQALAGLKSLRELRLDGNSLSDAGFARLGELPELEALSAIACRGVSGQEFTAAVLQGNFPRLRVLNVARTRFGIAGLGRIGGLEALEHLNVTECGVTDEGMAGIGACRRLVILEAGQNNFGVPGCAALAQSRTLRELGIEANQSIKDECFNSLKNLRGLDKLNVSRTACTEVNIRRLKGLLPNTRIQFNNQTF